jgi:hypothetical protein
LHPGGTSRTVLLLRVKRQHNRVQAVGRAPSLLAVSFRPKEEILVSSKARNLS